MNVDIKFDNNRLGGFEDYLSKKNRHRRQTADDIQTERQTEAGDLCFHTPGIMKRRENMKVAICRMDPILQYFHSLRSDSENKTTTAHIIADVK